MNNQTPILSYNFKTKLWQWMVLGLAGLLCVLAVQTMLMTPSVLAAEDDSTVEVNTVKAVCSGANFNLEQDQECDTSQAGKTLNDKLKTGIDIFTVVVGIVAVVMGIYAGFLYIISGGGDGVKKAKNTLIYTIIGIVVVVLSQTLIKYVIDQLS